LITYEDGSKDTVPIAKAEELRIIPPPPPVIIRQETFTNTQPDKVFTKTEVEASFPGGKDAWARYLKKIIEKNIDELSKENKSGTCRLRFIVGIDGSISDIKVMSMQGTKLAEVAVDAIRKGPRWTPAQQNGHFVASYREQPVTFTIQNNDKVFTKVEVEPSFPGGDMAWARYIKKTVEGNINELTTENKSGTCRLRFIVDVDGSVRDVKVLSMQGTKLAEISENAIRKGPKWVPAKQNGNVVSAYKEQPITFTIQEQ
jgi:outer membrane biosynthesis protein TonB